MWSDAVITNAGKALLEKWAGGGTFTIDGATAGTGTVPAVSLMSSVGLANEIQALSIVSHKPTEGGIEYKIQINAHDEAYIANQIGIWGHLDDGERSLIAIYQDETGQQVPSTQEMPDYAFALYATIQMDNSGDLQVTVDANALITLSTLEEVLANAGVAGFAAHIADQNNPHKVFPEQIGAAQEEHTHTAAEITGGEFAGEVRANALAASSTNAQVRNISSGTTDLVPGESALPYGEIYLTWEVAT